MTTTAAQRGWGPGWPNCQSSKMTTIRPVGRAITCRREAAVAFDYLVRRFHHEVENILGVPDDGAFACRPIRGSQPPVASNHSWGLALDLNWQQHPMGRSGTFRPGQVLAIHLLIHEMSGFRWGGDYDGRVDEMHFEYLGTPKDMALLVKRIQRLDPWPRYDGHVLKRGSRGKRVGMLQKRLGLTPTYVFAGQTETRVRAFQTQRHLEVDGKVGPASWKRLEWKLA